MFHMETVWFVVIVLFIVRQVHLLQEKICSSAVLIATSDPLSLALSRRERGSTDQAHDNH
jgi:hypothetical protein